jgi:L-alanine-DL-glutamate epimerase-like enolase superfamily enzyme
VAEIIDAKSTDLIMPKIDPTWRFALGARPTTQSCIVCLTAGDGKKGYGFAGEIPHLGFPIESVRFATKAFAETLLGKDPRDWRALADLAPGELLACKPAIAGVEMALCDLASQMAGVPLYRLLGGAYRHDIPILRILALKSPEEVARNAWSLVSAGYRYLKIKLDKQDATLDAKRIAAVRDKVGDRVHLTVDANQSYSVKEAIALYRQVEDLNIEYFEQPVPERDFDGLNHVAQSVGCLVEADESARSLKDVWQLVRMQAVHSISLKILKLGGLQPMAEAAALCKAGDIRCRVGASVGSRLLAATGLHFAAATPNIDYACELGEFDRLTGDPFTGLEIVDGCLTVPESVGLGVRLLEEGVRS